MIRELIGESYMSYRQFVGTGVVGTLFVAAILVVLFVMQKKRGTAALIISPLACIAAAAAHILGLITKQFDDKKKRYGAATFAALIFILTICASGANVFFGDQSVRAENGMHIPQYIVEAADTMMQKDPGTRVLTMPGWGSYFAAYTSGLDTISPEAGDESSADEDKRVLYSELSKVHPDMRKVTAIARGNDCTYVALSDGVWQDIPITALGYEMVLETDGCRLYREVSAP